LGASIFSNGSTAGRATFQQLYEKVPERLDEIRAYHLIGEAWSRKVREWLMTLPFLPIGRKVT
jgi:uncharacterized protein Yka (UPF0111/DUF47 family)